MKWTQPTRRQLEAELEALRRAGLDGVSTAGLDHLAAAALSLGLVLADGGPDIERLLQEVVDGLKDQKKVGRSARSLYGLSPDVRGLPPLVRETHAGEAYGVGPRQMQRRYRAQVHGAIALAIIQRLTPKTDGGVYQASIMKDWDRKAWVRGGGGQDLDFEADLDFFARDLVPVLLLPEAEKLSPTDVQEILVLSLYNYLDFTVQLETKPVNEVCTKIHDASFLEWVPPQMKDDALLIYTDEGAHAMMSNNLRRRVQDFTGVRPLRVKPQFLRVLDRLKAKRLPAETDFVTLLFVMVSETLITGSLSRLPKDPTVQPAVRQVAADHERDERRHHAYFSNLLRVVWDRLTPPMRNEAIILFPHLLRAFLDVDREATRRILERYPKVFPHPGAALAELASSPTVQSGLQASAKPTLALFTRVGVLAEPGAAESFEAAGFALPEAA